MSPDLPDMEIYLLRHGALGDNARQRYIGQTDLPLSAEGEAQALRLARWFDGMAIDAIYCSDLIRCRQTAERIAALGRHVAPQRCPALREISLGAWEGRERASVAAEEPERYAARGRDLLHVAPPGGESFADCLQRILPAWRAIEAAAARRVVVVAHAGVNRLLLSHALDLPLRQFMQIPQDYGCLNHLSGRAGHWRAQAINQRP
jgi:alpha-ribazole phosphatase